MGSEMCIRDSSVIVESLGRGDRFVKLNLLIPWSGLSRYTKSNFTDAISGLKHMRQLEAAEDSDRCDRDQ